MCNKFPLLSICKRLFLLRWTDRIYLLLSRRSKYVNFYPLVFWHLKRVSQSKEQKTNTQNIKLVGTKAKFCVTQCFTSLYRAGMHFTQKCIIFNIIQANVSVYDLTLASSFSYCSWLMEEVQTLAPFTHLMSLESSWLLLQKTFLWPPESEHCVTLLRVLLTQ